MLGENLQTYVAFGTFAEKNPPFHPQVPSG